MNLMKKIALVAMTLVLGTGVAVGVGSSMDTVVTNDHIAHAANKIASGTEFFLVPNSNWKVDNARFAIYFFGDGDAWSDMTYCGIHNMFEGKSPNDGKNYTGLIFCRMNPGTTANNWNNKWNQTADLTYDGTKNTYTVKDGTWDNGGGSWAQTKVFTVNFYIDGNKKHTKKIVDKHHPDYFEEREGKRFLHWCKDTTLSTKCDSITDNCSVYAKYEDISYDSFNILIGENFFGASANEKMYVYLARSVDGGHNADWPGVELKKEDKNYWYFYSYSIDASKSYDILILSGYQGTTQKGQTSNTPLEYVENICYEADGDQKPAKSNYNEVSLGYTIFKLGGAWDNHVATGNCYSNYFKVKTSFLNDLDETAQNKFKTSTETDIVNSRTRYEKWCSVNGDSNYYTGSVVSSSNISILGVISDSNATLPFLLIFVCAGLVLGCIFIVLNKKKRSNANN